jgi:hypothetical protein
MLQYIKMYDMEGGKRKAGKTKKFLHSNWPPLPVQKSGQFIDAGCAKPEHSIPILDFKRLCETEVLYT